MATDKVHSPENEAIDRMRRRLRYLCRRRATQELELILSRFWEDHANELNEQDLVELEALLSLDDMDLLAMCLGQKPFPSSFRAELTRRLLPAHLIKP